MATETVQTFDGQGNLLETREVEVPVEQFNRDSQYQKLVNARQTFRDNYANWLLLTAPQKDQANRQAQRAVANLIGRLLDQPDAGD